MAKYRSLPTSLRWISISLCLSAIATSTYYIFRFAVGGFVFSAMGYLYVIIAFLLPLTYLYFPVSAKAPRNRVPWYDFIAATFSFFIPLYFNFQVFEIMRRGWEISPPFIPFILGTIFFFLAIEGARRSGGLIFFFIVLFFAFFPLYADYLPGFLKGYSASFQRMIAFHSMGPEGLIGLPIRVLGELFIGFLIFGVVLQATGGGKFFLNFALSLLGHLRGGAAKVSIFASGLFGTMSGSVISNVLTTGSITIPAMKKTGFPPHFAGAVEAAASTGGVLMPPVMGATAFLMAAWLGMPYSKIIIAAALPSILFYLTLFTQIDAFAAKTGLKGLPRRELPSLKQTVYEGWFYVFAFFMLIFTLVYLKLEARAPFYTVGALLFLTMLKKATRLNFQSLIRLIEDLGKLLGEVIGLLLGVGLVISSLLYTGVAHAFSREVVALAGGNIYFLIVLGALTSFILGMGLTITACYIFLALVMAPALIEAGFLPLSAHLFIMYCGMLSFITPPVALGAFAAAGLAGSDPMRTGFQAMRLGIGLFILPFFFILSPTLIAQGPLLKILYDFSTAALGLALIGWGFEGFLLGIGRIGLFSRIVLFFLGILIGIPKLEADLIGIPLLLMTVGLIHLSKKIGVLQKEVLGISSLKGKHGGESS